LNWPKYLNREGYIINTHILTLDVQFSCLNDNCFI